MIIRHYIHIPVSVYLHLNFFVQLSVADSLLSYYLQLLQMKRESYFKKGDHKLKELPSAGMEEGELMQQINELLETYETRHFVHALLALQREVKKNLTEGNKRFRGHYKSE